MDIRLNYYFDQSKWNYSVVISNQCGSADNIDATFDDGGLTLSCASNPAISGVIAPESPLSVFNGTNCTGIWTLTLSNGSADDGGNLADWSLKICYSTPLLNVPDNIFQNFSLYPNPNKGNFNVKFTTQSSEDIMISIFDIRGRDIYTNSYANTTNFNQNINLENVQAGIYLVSISEGTKKVVRKIVIE